MSPASVQPPTCPSPSVFVAPDYPALCELVADRIAALVGAKPDAVLGLATGATPRGVYQSLVRRHQSGVLDFSRVTCFNLDEYYPMSPDSPHSYHSFMRDSLFHGINCRHWFIPDGRPRPAEEIARDCREYEARIASAGGIDLQLLGIGRTGHIGFNEPGSGRDTRTRLVTLAALTRQDASGSFGGRVNVPREAITMGIGTILEAREILMMATGAAKAEIVRTVWTQGPTARVPASWVISHPGLRVYLDGPAAALLPFSAL